VTYPTRIKLRTDAKGVEVYCEVLHPMSAEIDDMVTTSGRPNYITHMEFLRNGVVQAEFLLGKFVAAHPVIATYFTGAAKGDRISARWQDLAGNRGQADEVVP